jgi:hypothetical protein
MNTKKPATVMDDDTMRAEYDFSGGVRGKYDEQFRKGSNVVVLDPDVSKAFPTSRSVNMALRSLATRRAAVAKRPSKPGAKRPNKRTPLTRSATTRRRALAADLQPLEPTPVARRDVAPPRGDK